MKISLFIPCYIEQCFPRAAISVVKVLERLGHQVLYPTAQTCCGQPAFNSGAWKQAREIARHALTVFRDAEVVVTPSGSCGAMVKVFYRELFHGEPEYQEACALGDKTWEFSSFLVNKLGVSDLGATFQARVTFHDGCHGLRELHVRTEPRTLLAKVRGLELVEMAARDTCCGFGGTFAVKFPMISSAMGEAKCSAILETKADYVISLDSSCLMHLQGMFDQQRAPMRSLHLAEVLASGLS
ncbi:MAG TPA: (Fe-S)-binding protein [Verrucomicrobiae bacterium]|jgi:L-lactate dehydrogenase complex protein LldE|nr:(Fe-S)-binding protein [Verrucomicrobiae bacterium]